MRIHRLSAAKIRTLGPGLYNDGGNLLLQVTQGKDGQLNRSWLFRYSLPEFVVSKNGRPRRRTRDMGLGPYVTLGLHEARQRARELREQRLDGKDPIELRRARKASTALAAARVLTFDEAATQYLAAHEAGWSPKHLEQWRASLQAHVSPVLGNLPIRAINTDLVFRTLEPIWKTRTQTAARVRGRIECILDWAKIRGYRDDGENPARWRGHLDKLLPSPKKVAAVEHLAALPYSGIGEFLARLRQQTTTAASALEFCILAACRTSEVVGSTWDEIDLDQRIWSLPPSRMKGGRPHRVPLSDAALAVLERMAARRRSEFVFPGRDGGRLGKNGMWHTLHSLGRDDVTIHGFRSAFRDWAAEQTAFPNHVVEMALAHAIPDAVEAAYRRGDLFEKRRKLMAAWGAYCSAPPIVGEVVPIRSGQG
jgi:integrase